MSNIRVTFYLSTEAIKVAGVLRAGAGLLAVAEQDGHKPYTRYYHYEDVNSSIASLKVLKQAYSSVKNNCSITVVTDSSYIHSLMKYKGVYSKDYRKKDGHQMANATIVRELYETIDSKKSLTGVPYYYLAKSMDTVIFEIRRKVFNDLNNILEG